MLGFKLVLLNCKILEFSYELRVGIDVRMHSRGLEINRCTARPGDVHPSTAQGRMSQYRLDSLTRTRAGD